MKNKISNKLLIATTIIGSIALSGCASKTLQVIDKGADKVNVSQPKKSKVSKWKSLTATKKEDCVNCYATGIKEPIERVPNRNRTTVETPKQITISMNNTPFDELKLEEDKNQYIDESYSEDDNTPLYEAKSEEYKNPYLVDESYSEDNNMAETPDSYINNGSMRGENARVSSKNSIQVGAFRKYAGAKVYAKRYSLLTNKYNVKIKENVKENRPIYRVQIEGFSTENEAKEFMERYGLNGAFLVRR